MFFDQDDIESVALCAWKEARGDGELGCQLVMHVIANRVGAMGFAGTIHGVVYGKNQFTSMSVPSDPEFNLKPGPNDVIYQQCLKDAPQVLAGTMADPTYGSVWYANEAHVDPGGWYVRNIMDNPAHPVKLHYMHHTFRA